MLYFCGYYDGLMKNSAFIPRKFDSIEKVMLFVKAHIDYFRVKSYGFTVFTDERIKVGRHYEQKELMVWHRDGENCSGELVNKKLGWRIYIDAAGNIAEEHFEPNGG